MKPASLRDYVDIFFLGEDGRATRSCEDVSHQFPLRSEPLLMRVMTCTCARLVCVRLSRKCVRRRANIVEALDTPHVESPQMTPPILSKGQWMMQPEDVVMIIPFFFRV